MPDIYTKSFDHVCQVTIPGTAHGFRGVCPLDLSFLGAGAIPAPLWPDVVTIKPSTQDITFAFLVPTSGHVYVANPATSREDPA